MAGFSVESLSAQILTRIEEGALEYVLKLVAEMKSIMLRRQQESKLRFRFAPKHLHARVSCNACAQLAVNSPKHDISDFLHVAHAEHWLGENRLDVSLTGRVLASLIIAFPVSSESALSAASHYLVKRTLVPLFTDSDPCSGTYIMVSAQYFISVFFAQSPSRWRHLVS